MPLTGRILQTLPTALAQRAVAALRRSAARPPTDALGERIRRRAVSKQDSKQERGMPRRLREDLQRALELPDAAARRASVDRIVQDITDGGYGRIFQRRAMDAARAIRPSDAD